MSHINTTAINTLLQEEITAQELQLALDNIGYRYARLALLDSNACGAQLHVANDLYYLRLLRQAFLTIAMDKQDDVPDLL